MKNELVSFAVKALIEGALLFGLVFFAVTLYSKTTVNTNSFSVEGKASGKVTADSVKIEIGNMIDGTNPSDVQTEADRRITKVKDWVQKLGINPDNIKLKKYAISTKFDGNQKAVGYKMDVSVEITVNDLVSQDKKIAQVIESGTLAGLNEVRLVDYSGKSEDATLDDLRKQAIDNAKAKLNKASQASGINLGDPKSVVVKVNREDATDKKGVDAVNYDLEVTATLYY
jgi:uncharacterized protein YggE